MRPSFPFFALLAAAVLVAGCVEDAAPSATLDDASAPPLAPRSRVVVADVDTGINPYHVEFRDDSPEGRVHPSEYLAGFPADTPALELTLDAPDYESAVLADCAVWQAIEPQKLYWIPGTRIVGAITFDAGPVESCTKDEMPFLILDPQGHGTMTASRIAGATYSLCPECKIVFVQGFSDDSMYWAASQPYVDLQTNSWGALPTDYAATGGDGGADPAGLDGIDRAKVMDAAAMQPVFVAGGNGLLGFFGVTGHPAYLDDVAGPAGIIMVGGHDGGYFTPWTMTMPHVVADANAHPAAHRDSIDGGDETTGGGTSGATPFAASAFARMILDARIAVGDVGTGVREGNLVWGGAGVPTPADGPLSDGFLSIDEAKVFFYHNANPRPVRDGPHDGPDTCDPTNVYCAPYNTVPVEWGTIPEGVPAYYFVGYGQVGELTLNATLASVLGEAPIPDRPEEDRFYGFDNAAREAFDG